MAGIDIVISMKSNGRVEKILKRKMKKNKKKHARRRVYPEYL